MLTEIWHQIQAVLDLEADAGDIDFLAIGLRTVVIYIVTLAIVRLGSKRFLSRATAFDVIVGIMVGSIMSRAINGSSPFFPTILAGGVLVGMHWLFAILAFRTDWFGSIVKGQPNQLVEDGAIQWEAMANAGLSRRDLVEALRMQGMEDPERIRSAYLERNGQISLVPMQREPQVIVVPVEEGVRTVRIEIG